MSRISKSDFLFNSTVTVFAILVSSTAAFANFDDQLGEPLSGHAYGHHVENIGSPASTDMAERRIEISIGDYFFSINAINIKNGEIIEFYLKNTGENVHEFNIGTDIVHRAHQEELLKLVREGVVTRTDVHDHAKHVHGRSGPGPHHKEPSSVLLEPGDTAEIVWRFNTNTELSFACNMPGHFERGMVGAIRIDD